MKPFRPLLAAVAAAAFLAAGCDYWQNLVDEKVVTSTKLDIRILDTYTKRPLREAHCKDAARGREWTPDREGVIFVSSPETGYYVISCTSKFYYDASIEFPLTPAGASLDLHMARLGGAENWYLDDEERRVAILNTKKSDPFTVLRFPSPIQMIASPEDALGRFDYYWKFAKATRLSRDINSVFLDSNVYNNFAAPPDVAEGMVDTLTLIVKSRLNGNGKGYLVDSVRRVFTWKKNQLPKFDALNDPTNFFYVGCLEPRSQPLRVPFAASDPDGECSSVKFRSEDPNSALGKMDTTIYSCRSGVLNHQLRNPFPKLRNDSSMEMNNVLLVTVTDDNGGMFDSSIDFISKSNILPVLKVSLANSGYGFTGEPVRLDYDVSDMDEAVRFVAVDWGGENARKERDYQRENTPQRHDTATWTYYTPGSKPITVTARDPCGVDTITYTGTFQIGVNRKPTIQLEHVRGFSPDSVTFLLTAIDKDITEGLMDKFTHIHINWGDSTETDTSLNIASTYDSTFTHLFMKPPNSKGEYRIRIDIFDDHNGIGKLDTSIQAAERTGNP